MDTCPECNTDFDWFIGTAGLDEWTCPACNAILDVWWSVNELLWCHDYDVLPQFDSREILFKTKIGFTQQHRICCDAVMCKCPVSIAMPLSKVQYFLNKNDIRPVDDIYDCNESYTDCRACINYSGHNCIPFRSWIRYANKYGFKPPKVGLCYEFEEDTPYCQDQKVDIAAIHKKISDTMYYSSTEIG
jgi:hypothetical protein